MSRSAYRGRFAPSPTGRLHMGSLLAAVASYLDARAHQGFWHIRIEDIDPPREQAGASTAILEALAVHQLHADAEPTFQSQQLARYASLCERLKAADLVYACPCSRKQLAHNASHRNDCGYHSGQQIWQEPVAWRLRQGQKTRHFCDGIQGATTLQRDPPLDDCILFRKEGLPSYTLAVVADDHEEGITHVVRGADLIDPTFDQLALYEALGWEPPVFCHVPVINNDQGQKMSKQNLAKPLDNGLAADNLRTVLQLLGIALPPPLKRSGNPSNILEFAIGAWSRQPLAGKLGVRLPTETCQGS